MTRKYAVRTHFVFSGTFFIKAGNKGEAEEQVKNHCGLVLGGGIHSTLPDDMADWDFPVHPIKTISRARVNRVQEKIYEQTA
ncbi:MAG: hypothetical protein LBH43_16300 [Treponema sp.]|jgi:hypothetical protein|nr:hypothetical protein [Treponema sp.]